VIGNWMHDGNSFGTPPLKWISDFINMTQA